MDSAKIHKYLGLTLLLPILAWVITGVVFIIKPGYSGAYDQISVKTYAQEISDQQLLPQNQGAWQEIRVLHTVLGKHVLQKREGVWQHFNGHTGQLWKRPSNQELLVLLQDAILANPERYGDSLRVEKGSFVSNTDVRFLVDWNTLSIRQTGRDTDFINALYRVHYLQWTDNKLVDKYLGVTGLLLLLLLAAYGLALYLRKR